MQLIPLTPDLEEKAGRGLVPGQEVDVLDREKKPNVLFKKWGINKLAKTVRAVISVHYNNGSNEKYIKELILRFVDCGSDLTWDRKRYILQQLVACPVGGNKIEIMARMGSSDGPELKLRCPLRQKGREGDVDLHNIIDNCCLNPENRCSNYQKYLASQYK